MIEALTDRARRTLALANEEARRAKQERVGTEHILLGLLLEGTGVGSAVLKITRVSLKRVRAEIPRLPASAGRSLPQGELPLAEAAERALGYAKAESRGLGHNYVGTEHILLGLLDARDSAAAQVLGRLGFDLDVIRHQVTDLLGAGPPVLVRGCSDDWAKGLLRPGQEVDHMVRQAIQFCWMALPEDKRSVEEVRVQMRRILERALTELAEDDSAFRPTP